MKPLSCAVVLAVVFLLGCGSEPPGEPVRLLTLDRSGCFTFGVSGALVIDAQYGTAIVDETTPRLEGATPRPWPVAWPAGFTGRKVGNEVEVLAPDGEVVARTGRRYSLDGGYDEHSGVDAFEACGNVR